MKNITDKGEIDKAHEQAKMSLNHLITYELKRRELMDEGTNQVTQQFHLGPSHFSIKENQDKYKENAKEDKFEYFDA